MSSLFFVPSSRVSDSAQTSSTTIKMCHREVQCIEYTCQHREAYTESKVVLSLPLRAPVCSLTGCPPRSIAGSDIVGIALGM